MLYLASPAAAELEVKKSRFLAEIFPVSAQKEARILLKERRECHAGARHVVHAFVLGGGTVCGCSDDGEPSGTAGRPVLDVLRGADVTGCMITVARWFGGTLLGTGGLVKAYASAAKSVLAAADLRERIPAVRFFAEMPYAALSGFERRAAAAGAEIVSRAFDACARVEGTVAADAAQVFAADTAEWSAGRILLVFPDSASG